MPAIRLLLTLLTCCLLATGGRAGVWTPETLPMVHLKDARRYVCNPDNVLPQAAVDSMDAALARLEREKGVQSVVVAVEHLEGDDPYDFGMALARKYGVGQRDKDNGLIVILATKDRSYQILTGRGLEGTLPDAICKRVENRIMLPRLKEEDWGGAMTETVKALSDYIMGDDSLLRAEEEEDTEAMWVALGVVVVLFLVFLLMLYFGTHHNCPRCGAKGSMTVQAKTKFRRQGRHYVRQHWVCSKCGFSQDKDTRDVEAEAVATGALLGTTGGYRRSGGGGFGGGSFGGGSFGGGGAGGRF